MLHQDYRIIGIKHCSHKVISRPDSLYLVLVHGQDLETILAVNVLINKLRMDTVKAECSV